VQNALGFDYSDFDVKSSGRETRACHGLTVEAGQGDLKRLAKKILVRPIALDSNCLWVLAGKTMSEKPKNIKKKSSAAIVREPNMTDRELLLFFINQMIFMRTQMLVLQDMIIKQTGTKPDDVTEMSAFYYQEAVKEYERDVHNFISSLQNIEGN
jgi:hypothetical protein